MTSPELMLDQSKLPPTGPVLLSWSDGLLSAMARFGGRDQPPFLALQDAIAMQAWFPRRGYDQSLSTTPAPNRRPIKNGVGLESYIDSILIEVTSA